MADFKFGVEKVQPVKGHKLEGSKDYDVKVTIDQDKKIIFDGVIIVRKTKGGVFPDSTAINKLIKDSTIKKQLEAKIKQFIKEQK